jgi:hypothetical protein
MDLDKPTQNYIVLVVILLGVGLLYNRYQSKLDLQGNNINEHDAIQKYLLSDETFYDSFDNDVKQSYRTQEDDNDNNNDAANSHKKHRPILWIHLQYHYNARHWNNFGSRSSYNLNQPYLYLTIKSIIDQCKNSFRICIIDDESFFKLIPSWSIHLSKLADPVQKKMRFLGCLHLLEKYGGLWVPPSFLCMRNLIGMYNMGTGDSYIESATSSSYSPSDPAQIEMFIAENIDHNVTSTDYLFSPDISFLGAKKNAPILTDFIDFVQRTCSSDYTEQSCFLGEFSRWCQLRIQRKKVKLIEGKLIGVKTMENRPVVVEDLMGEQYIELYPQMFGIYIPIQEIMKRTRYNWFLRMSPRQLLESDVTLCKYILLASRPDNQNTAQNYLGQERHMEEDQNRDIAKSWLGYWRVPSNLQLWGFKPNFFSGSLLKSQKMQASKNGL